MSPGPLLRASRAAEVLADPATAAQRAKAEKKLAKHEHEAARLAAQVGDADEVTDRHGDLPPDRRTWHLSGIMTFTTSSGILPSDGSGNHHDPG